MNDNFIVSNGEYICLVRLLCNRDSLCKLLNRIKTGFDLNKEYSNMVQFISYSGNPYPIEKMLQSNFQTKNMAPKSKYVKKVNENDFLDSNNRRYVFELIVDSKSDVSDIHYLMLLLNYLGHKTEKFNVLISSIRTESNRYSPISSSDYFRLSYLLFFYNDMSLQDEFFIKIFNSIKVYCNIPIKKEQITKPDIRWRSLAVNYEKQPHAGKLVPIIPITIESFEALITDYSNINIAIHNNQWLELVDSLCNDYITRIEELFPCILSNDFYVLIDSDNCLEVLVFLSTLYFIILDEKEQLFDFLNITTISNIHEACTDYSQGIIQLIENVINHVVLRENHSGCGVFSLRFRNVIDAENIYIKSKEDFPNIKYFMEILITDLPYEDFQSIIEKFYNNVRKRLLKQSNNDDFLVNSKFYFSQIEDAKMFHQLESTVSVETVKEIKNYTKQIRKEKKNKVVLSDLFLNDSNTPLKDYLSSSENVAFHYGLQILNSVIFVADGHLYVKSGCRNTDTFNSMNGKYLDMDSLVYDVGTLYIIRIPIKLNRDLNYIDSLSVAHNAIGQTHECIFLNDINNINKFDKETACKILYKNVQNAFDINRNNTPMLLGVIDCSKLKSKANCSKTYLYEIIAKALFLYIVNEASKIGKLALINLENKYDVIKIFRQFALFFDRNGYNALIKNTKNVFIVDKNGSTDVLFRGNSIKSISESLCLSQLYGGTDEKAMEIIKYLSRGGDIND